MYLAAFDRLNRLYAWHPEAAAIPEACSFRVLIDGRTEASAEIARVKGYIRLAPVRAQGRNRIFKRPRRFRPFADAMACLDDRKGVRKLSQPLVPEPSCAANGQVCAGRKREDDLVFDFGRQPLTDIVTDIGNRKSRVPAKSIMLQIDAYALEAGIFNNLSVEMKKMRPAIGPNAALTAEADDRSEIAQGSARKFPFSRCVRFRALS